MPKISRVIGVPVRPVQQPPEDYVDQLPGGRADQLAPGNFDTFDLAHGAEHEKEHSSDPMTPWEIAMDHLKDDPNYYDKLDSMESGEDDYSGAWGRAIKILPVFPGVNVKKKQESR